MKIHEITEACGKIVQGVNTTVDVKVGETERQAKKFFGGNGKPKPLSGSDSHKAFNMGLVQEDSPLQAVTKWAGSKLFKKQYKAAIAWMKETGKSAADAAQVFDGVDARILADMIGDNDGK